MSYTLGVDLGTTLSAAAIEQSGRVRPCALGDTGFTSPSIVLPRDDGRTLIGEPAAMHGGTAPVRTLRVSHPAAVPPPGADAQDAMRLLLTAIVDEVTAQQEARPDQVILAQPAAYTHTLDTPFGRLAGKLDGDVRLVPAPIAALTMVDRHDRLAEGATLAVLDLGGDVAEVTLARRVPGGFEPVGRPALARGLGGAGVEESLLARIDDALDGEASAQAGAAGATPAADRLRTACRQATHDLLRADETVVEVPLADGPTPVRLTAADLWRILEPRLATAIGALQRAVDEASLTPAHLSAVVLVGAPVRIPRLVRWVAEQIGRPVMADPAPELSVAFGAALLGSSAVARRRAVEATPERRGSGPMLSRTAGRPGPAADPTSAPGEHRAGPAMPARPGLAAPARPGGGRADGPDPSDGDLGSARPTAALGDAGTPPPTRPGGPAAGAPGVAVAPAPSRVGTVLATRDAPGPGVVPPAAPASELDLWLASTVATGGTGDLRSLAADDRPHDTDPGWASLRTRGDAASSSHRVGADDSDGEVATWRAGHADAPARGRPTTAPADGPDPRHASPNQDASVRSAPAGPTTIRIVDPDVAGPGDATAPVVAPGVGTTQRGGREARDGRAPAIRPRRRPRLHHRVRGEPPAHRRTRRPAPLRPAPAGVDGKVAVATGTIVVLALAIVVLVVTRLADEDESRPPDAVTSQHGAVWPELAEPTIPAGDDPARTLGTPTATSPPSSATSSSPDVTGGAPGTAAPPATGSPLAPSSSASTAPTASPSSSASPRSTARSTSAPEAVPGPVDPASTTTAPPTSTSPAPSPDPSTAASSTATTPSTEAPRHAEHRPGRPLPPPPPTPDTPSGVLDMLIGDLLS